MRTCRLCQVPKPLDDDHFHRNGHSPPKPPRYKWTCRECHKERQREYVRSFTPEQRARRRAEERARREAHRQQRRKAREAEREAEITDIRAVKLVDRMGREDRAEYLLEGCLPLTGSLFGFTDEDLDISPVPRGCHDCYLTAVGSSGTRCTSCPSKGQPMRRKAA